MLFAALLSYGTYNMKKDLYNLRVLTFCFKLYNLESVVFFLNYLDPINDKCQFYNLRNNHIRIPFAKYKLVFECIRILQNTPHNNW